MNVLDVNVSLVYEVEGEATILLQVEAASVTGQQVTSSHLDTGNAQRIGEIADHDNDGKRQWLLARDRLDVSYRARVEVARDADDLSQMSVPAIHELDPRLYAYTLPSRFCPSDRLGFFACETFDQQQAGARIAAMRDWIERKITYTPGASGPTTTAADTLLTRQGVCRDYAHLLISLARACRIPARYACVYSPTVSPPDFHAVAEVWLDGAWHIVDATGMTNANACAIVGTGRDAADVAFLTSYDGQVSLIEQSVSCTFSQAEESVRQAAE